MSERIVNDPSLHGWTEENGKWVWDGTDSGAGMIISETEPDAVDGTQWLNALTGEVFIYDDGKWLEFPGGKDGAAGADGKQIWSEVTPDGDIYYDKGNVGISGTVDAAGFTVNGSPIGGGGGLPDGGYTYGWNITATDFIATSDERAKDNITTAPVGLIDSLKGREWEWKESGEKGSGVVAQELEQVLPHLVHTDDDGMKSVAYNGLLAYLIEEIKLLKAEVEALKS